MSVRARLLLTAVLVLGVGCDMEDVGETEDSLRVRRCWMEAHAKTGLYDEEAFYACMRPRVGGADAGSDSLR